MNSPIISEQALFHDVEALRDRFPQTQELYREVCALLFFRYGLTPTANKLYQLVRKGSMSAPSQALAKFWEDLRNKSRTKIEHPDLPEELGVIAGEMIATLWTKAQTIAHESLDAYRREAHEIAAKARTDAVALETERAELQRSITRLEEELAQAGRQLSAQREDLAAANEARSTLMEMLEGAKLESRELNQQLAVARQEFSAELGKLHAASKLAEERTWATEKRMLVDLDRERTQSARLQKELETLRSETARTAEVQRQELSALQVKLSDGQQQNGKLEGMLQTITASLEQTELEAKRLQAELEHMKTQAATELERNSSEAQQSPRKRRTKTGMTLGQRFRLD